MRNPGVIVEVEADDLEVLQLFLPSGMFCECHQCVQPDLADPSARVGLPPPRLNRAQRRARYRRR